VLLAAAGALLGVSLLLPPLPLLHTSYHALVFVDITQSMNTRDMKLSGEPVSRLAFVRRALRDALAALPCGSRIGIGLFTEHRVLLLMSPVEVCGGYDDLRGVIDRIDGRMSWAGASEVSKGLFSALRTARELPDKPGVVFITDGHEAPPLRPGREIPWEGKAGEVPGVIVGVGGDTPAPIPKFDPEGNALGFWQADEVLQTDRLSAGRSSSSSSDALVDESGHAIQSLKGSGTEHLSSLKESHLQALAQRTQLLYARLGSLQSMRDILRTPRLAQRIVAPRDLRFVPAGLALLLLTAVFAPGAVDRLRGLRARLDSRQSRANAGQRP
jgi:mxaL protein